MASLIRYQYIPEDDSRPSPDTVDDTSPPAGPTNGKLVLHPTLYLRAVASILFLTATIILILTNSANTSETPNEGYSGSILPCIVFLSFALVRNVYVLVRDVLGTRLTIRMEVDGQGKGKAREGAGGGRGLMLSLMVDLMIVVCLIIMLRIARKRYNGWGGVSEDRAYVTVLVGLLFYTLGICDCGTPSSIFTHLAYNGKKKGSDIRSGVPQVSYQEIKEGPSEEGRELRLSEEEDNN